MSLINPLTGNVPFFSIYSALHQTILLVSVRVLPVNGLMLFKYLSSFTHKALIIVAAIACHKAMP
jgi:hypothetical protein